MKTLTIAWITLAILCFSACQNNSGSTDHYSGDINAYTGENFTVNIRTTAALTPEDERQGFKLPEGFEINLYASEPDIGKPINIAFDAKGRMWVTQSFEYPFPSAPGKGKDKLTILEDTDNDGKADKFTAFSDTLNIPIGVLPMNDGAVVYSIPNIYKYTDADGDGKADGQKKLLGPFKTKDTHGMINNLVRGYDGWIHSCHGYTNRDTVAGADGHAISMISGNTFRFRPDGSRVEHTTDGRINPFGLVYDEMGYLYSTDCHTSPLYQLIRNADYPQWGKEEGMGYAPDMTPMSNEATALAGIGYYADFLFPEPYRNNFFVGDVVRSRVYRYSFSFKGSTPAGKREEDFVLSKDPWFRPVDVKLGPDGALYIADFYNSIIGHYEVPLDHPKRDHTRGRIWRITYKGKHNEVHDWTKAQISDLLQALNMDNMPVRMAAADQLADRIGKDAIAPVATLLSDKSTSARKYIHALWVLERLGTLQPSMLQVAATHTDPLIRLHAMRILAEEKSDEQVYFPLVLKGLEDKDPHVRRAAVELLAKYPTMRSLNLALKIRSNIPEYETHLLYTSRMVLRDILRNPVMMKAVASSSWEEQYAGYISDVLMAVPSADAGSFLFRYISRYKAANNRAPAIFKHIARFAPYNKLDSAVIIAVRDNRPDSVNILLYKSLHQGIEQRGAEGNAQLIAWGKSLAQNILQTNPYSRGQSLSAIRLQRTAIEISEKYGLKKTVPAIEKFLYDLRLQDMKLPGSNVPDDEVIRLKTTALKSLISLAPAIGEQAAIRILNNDSSDTQLRNEVINMLGGYSGNIANRILKEIKNVLPQLQHNFAITLAGSPEGKDILFQKIRSGEIFARTILEPKVQERILYKASPAQQKLFAQLTSGIDPVDKQRQEEIAARLAAFEKAMQSNPPSIDSGHIVFVQNCSPCHSIAEEGGNIGPNLDGVAKWGPKSLAEKILDPNRNVSENFRSYTVRMKDGKIVNGLYRRDEGAVIVFADLNGKEFSIPKKDIAEQTASKLTLMPDNFRERLNQNEFNQLIHFLLNPKGI